MVFSKFYQDSCIQTESGFHILGLRDWKRERETNERGKEENNRKRGGNVDQKKRKLVLKMVGVHSTAEIDQQFLKSSLNF